MTRSAAQIRQEFVDYFVQRCGHEFVPSSPVVPHDDPTLLFTNAGMNQFKPLFLGTAERTSKFGRLRRAVNSQKCIRAGGKHNDLDDVGHDTYHHTFFEMLGNWSFGDYFKAEAITWAWDLLTNVWGLDPRRLHATYFGGLRRGTVPAAHQALTFDEEAAGDDWELAPDLEARDLWLSIAGLPPERVHAGNMKDNFWEMGDTGPCGPCSEIHIDLSPAADSGHLVNKGDPRVIEIWNLVFIQFNRNPDRSLTLLPARHVDTGMGFERITAVIQGQRSNYDTDIFAPIFAAIQEVTGAPPYGGRLESDPGAAADRAALRRDIAYRVIADHIRTLTFALADGAVPDKEGRGYVLRRILRRAVRYGWQDLDMHTPFLYRLAPAVAAAMGAAFPELYPQLERVAALIRDEEESFGRTLARGLTLFDEAVARAGSMRVVSGADAFRLHDTYGFPIDLTEIMAREQGLAVDLREYERLMDEARRRARDAARSSAAVLPPSVMERLAALQPTDDFPKYRARSLRARVLALLPIAPEGCADAVELLCRSGEGLPAGTAAALVVDRTCFYAEQGGQVGDSGSAKGPNGEFEIALTRRLGDVVLHEGLIRTGYIAVGEELELAVGPERTAIERNHTATHLLNLALRETLDRATRSALQQKGSLVDAARTRFDFSHPRALTAAELAEIEAEVVARIRADLPVHTNQDAPVAQAAARRINTLRAVFGEKYPDEVRVVSIGVPVAELLANPSDPRWFDYSVEFCGGTHVASTSVIGDFVLTHEEAVAKGVRRLVGITGPEARAARAAGAALRAQADALLNGTGGDPAAAAAQLSEALGAAQIPLTDRHALHISLARLQEAARQLNKAAAAASAGQVVEFVSARLMEAPQLGATRLLIVETPEFPAEQLKHGADVARQKADSIAVFFGCRSGDKVLLLAAFSADLVARGLKAGDLVRAVAPLVGGGGGGPPALAQAGGRDASRLPEALRAAEIWIRERLG